ncbi:hypothetical protein [Methanococcoides alaskense]|uniref:Uncharacterized protein n=1 Tax=Methanococcoides alaskense TaxID=325778 RepID=A0AA90U0D6_9EURY|nr:hypothetical protein [Methanococcoides alaskense]MDA0524438.1 hypothetical protein [Methanococcoides alaskense]MDR6223256.1 hypothetical protein [Methanococcoides alaskense]
MTDDKGTDEISTLSKQIEEFKVDLNYNSKMGQLAIWMPEGGHEMRVVAKDKDNSLECVFVEMHHNVEEGREAYDKLDDAQKIKDLFTRTGFGKICK